MTDNANINWQSMRDKAIIEKIGLYVKYQRLSQNKTQEVLASEAGINRSTLNLVEAGKIGNFLILIQLLRALNLLAALDAFEVKTTLSPLQLARIEQVSRKRASKVKKNDMKPKSTW